jgi:hypothetical protein
MATSRGVEADKLVTAGELSDRLAALMSIGHLAIFSTLMAQSRRSPPSRMPRS